MALKKKKTVRVRARTGLAAIPVDSWENCKYYFHTEVDKKDVSKVIKDYIKKNFKKAEVTAIFANPEYHFTMYTHNAAAIHWMNIGNELPEKYQGFVPSFTARMKELVETGKVLLAEKAEAEKAQGNVIVLTPQQRLAQKINNTIMVDLDDLEDEWIAGETTTRDVYNLFRLHGLTGAAVEAVRARLEGWLLDYDDAYNKKCEQAVEGYSHLTRKELKRRLDATETMIADLDKVKAATKAVRKTRVKKPRAADKQVAKVKYLKESNDYKLVSINPIVMVGAMRVFTFNAKTRVLAEYVSDNPNGFEIQGTSIKKFDVDLSRSTRLRKPDDILPDILSKTPKQIDNIFKGLTTKMSVPNGRLNDDTVLLRALDR